jgi:hypothetical protein
MDEIVDWLTFHNHRRRHTSQGYVRPMQPEQPSKNEPLHGVLGRVSKALRRMILGLSLE